MDSLKRVSLYAFNLMDVVWSRIVSMLLWLLSSLKVMLASYKTALTVGALKRYFPGTSVNTHAYFKYPRQNLGNVSTPEY